MKERVLIKKNVFTCVMFGAIFLFVLCESIFKSNALSAIVFIIAIPIFMLSIINLVINILEDFNNKITSYLSNIEQYEKLSLEDYYKLRNSEEKGLNEVIREISSKYSEKTLLVDDLKSYFSAFRTRKSIRRFRRIMLYIYYLVFMIILLLLLLHTEIYTFLEDSAWVTKVNMDMFELWSLIIILLEIMMKDIIEDVITYIIKKKMGIDLECY